MRGRVLKVAMEPDFSFEHFLRVKDSTKAWVRDRVIELLAKEGVVPSFSEAALRLCELTQKMDVSTGDLAEVVSLDPGLATRCLRVASSVAFAARPIESIEQAVMMVGIQEVRRIAISVGTIDTFSHFRGKIDWKRFWLHNILVARLSDRTASIFRSCSGIEYLAGLIHDVGKLVIEHYFPREFDQIILGAYAKQCTHAAMEMELLGLDHTQIGAAVCSCLKVPHHLRQAIRYHHDPLNLDHTSDPFGDGGFLAATVSIADRVANLSDPYVEDGESILGPLEETSEWFYLTQLTQPGRLELNLRSEIECAHADLSAFL